ncbi:MAG: beta-N-acetylhexosaminidase [Phycisphaerales bacterium]
MSASTRDAERLGAGMIGVGFDGLETPETLRELVRGGVRCVVLFARNYRSPAQVAALVGSIKLIAPVDEHSDPVMVCVDHEGGRVQRFRDGFTAIPSMREVGASPDPELAATAAAQAMLSELVDAGIDLNFAPVVDVDTNPANPVIGERSFGRDPHLVGRCAAAFIGYLQLRMAACAKHFPGHGDTHVDSHLSLPRVSHPLDRLQRVEWPPFHAAIAAHVASIMTSHVVFDAIDPARPATLSPLAVDGLLRRPRAQGGFGFDGLVFTDDMEMKAIADHFGFAEACVDAALAGCDVLLVCSDLVRQRTAIESLAKAIVDGRLPRERVATAARRRSTVRWAFGNVVD